MKTNRTPSEYQPNAKRILGQPNRIPTKYQPNTNRIPTKYQPNTNRIVWRLNRIPIEYLGKAIECQSNSRAPQTNINRILQPNRIRIESEYLLIEYESNTNSAGLQSNTNRIRIPRNRIRIEYEYLRVPLNRIRIEYESNTGGGVKL